MNLTNEHATESIQQRRNTTVVSGQLEESLRHEIESYLDGRLSGIKQEISSLQSQLNESLSRLLDRQSDVPLDGAVAASISDHLRSAHEAGIDLAASESTRAKASSDMAIVKAAISEIDEQDSQANILKILVNRAAAFAPRVAFFVVKGEESIGWRARGFAGTVGDNAIHQMKFALAADTAVGSAARSRNSWSGGPGSHSEDHLIINRLGDDPPARIVAVPLVVRQRTVAVLYADSGALDSEAINLEAIETLVRVSGMAVELLAGRAGQARAPQPQPAGGEDAPAAEPETYAPAAYTPTAEYDELTPVVEESAPAAEVSDSESRAEEQPVAPQTAAQPEPQAQFQAESEPQTVTEFEAPATEVPPLGETPVAQPVETAPLAEEAPAPPQPRRRYGENVELPVDVSSEDERRLHNDARRFARLLVSEIKLYNEQKVSEGRSQSDLYPRLREYIDRSREMYDKRVKPEVAQRYDYFHHELVSTLAEGDEAKLGSAYPGATVSA
jgi:hypothetical protein